MKKVIQKTLTLKLPDNIEAQLNNYAQKKGVNKTEIIRRALTEYISHEEIGRSGSFLELSRDMMGCIVGPSDLSTNKRHFEIYGK
jgi:metal-responsive CopG/Arc/MetJ family transcriptional regulator